MTSVATTCPYCGVGCGVLVDIGADGEVTVKGDPQHPANYGRLCSKGAALADTLDLEGRLLTPEIDGQAVGWDAALDAVAGGLNRIIDAHGPESVAFYVSGQLLTEDYYVANKLMKGFIGSGNIDTNSRLCMASSVAGHKRAFGADAVPGCYEDLEQADLIVLVGSNAAWCHPVVYQRIAQAKKDRPALKLVVIDPRRTATCEIADLHLPIRPGADVTLFNGLLNHLRRENRLDYEYLEQHTEGFAAALDAAQASAPSIPAVAQTCEVAEEDLAQFYRWFATTDRTITLYSQGVNQSSSGTDKVNSIINCHLATGRIGRPGTGPFSLTGQPNAMGGREVGGLANQLAAHMDFDNTDNIERVQRFWDAPRMARSPGLKAVELFQAIADGRVKAVWIMATNPAVSLPDAKRVRAALARCELVIVSDCMRHTDSTACADILLPAATWGEKSGTVTNSERRITRTREFLDPPGEAKPDWWIITQVARRMGHAQAFPYELPADIFREHARLSGFENAGTRAFDIGAFENFSNEDYANFAPVQWPVPTNSSDGRARLFTDGRFCTPSGKARLIAVTPRPPVTAVDDCFPLVLNTGRVRDHWHTLTRTGKSARLSQHTTEPFVQIHPHDADRFELHDQDLVRVESQWGEVVVRAQLSSEQRPGSVFVPMHWNQQFASQACVDIVVNPATDPVSGQPESKHTPVRIVRYPAIWHGFVLARAPVDVSRAGYWTLAKGEKHWRYELAGYEVPESWPVWARAQWGERGEWIDFEDRSAGRYRGALIEDDRLTACVFISNTPRLPSRTWLADVFNRNALSASDRRSLLAGRSVEGGPDVGRVVCACFAVGVNTLRRAIDTRQLHTPEAVGQELRAGTNCGSCLPELKALIDQVLKTSRAA
jgi:assimilatory nitrate reductase catalytic subunit